MRLPVLNNRPSAVGTFGKAIEGSLSLNFGLSGGKHCDTECRHHPESTADNPTHACYAVRTEVRPDRIQLHDKLLRHEEMAPEKVVRRGIEDIQNQIRLGRKIPWLRISTNGSVPMPQDASKKFVQALRDLLEYCDEHEIPVHFPVETPTKAAFYRKVLGWRVVVRESAQTERRFLQAGRAVSCVAGDSEMTRVERVGAAKDMARKRFEKTGRKTIVCPAVAARYLSRNNNTPSEKAKCGNCVACSQPGWDVVYPLH